MTMNFIKKHFFRGSNNKSTPVRKFSSTPNIRHSERSIGEKLNNHHSDSVGDLHRIDEISIAGSGDSISVVWYSIQPGEYGEETELKHVDSVGSLDFGSQVSDPSTGSEQELEAGVEYGTTYFSRCISSQLKDIFSSKSSLPHAVSKEDGLDYKGPTSPTQPITTVHVYGSNTNLMVNTIESGTDDSRMSRSASRPQMIVNNRGSQNLKSIADNTDCQLRQFEDEKYRVLTSVDRQATEILTRKNGDAVVVIIGHEYDGKSFAAKCTQARLTHTWENAIINFPEEMDEIQLEEDVRICILKDDLFGKKDFSANVLTRWEPRFDDMLSKVRARRIGLIFSMNKRVFDSYILNHNRHELFNEENIIDLTSTHKLSNADKKGILKCQLQRYPKAKVVFTDDKEKDNVETFAFDGDLCIYEGHLDNIIDIPCTYGFPKQAAIYASSLENIQRREKFFLEPTFHCLTISKIRKSNETNDTESAFAIETSFAMRGNVDMDTVVDRYDKIRSHRGRHISRYTKHSGGKLPNDTINNCASSRAGNMNTGVLFRKGLANLNSWILSQDKQGFVCFSSPVVYNATALDLSRKYEVDVIKYASWSFIEICIRPEDEENKRLIFQVYRQPRKSPIKDELYRKFFYEVSKNSNVSDVCGHSLMKRKWFTDGLFEYLASNRSITEFITATDRQTDMTVLFHGMHSYTDVDKSGVQNMTEDLIKSSRWREHFKYEQTKRESFKHDPSKKENLNEQSKRKHEKCSLLEACRLGKYSTFLCLKKHLDKTCLGLAVQAGSIEIARCILRERRFICFASLSDLLATACKVHCKSNPETGERIARLLMDNDCSIDRKDGEHDPLIHDAVKGGNAELTRLLCKLNCTVDIKDNNGDRPLHKSVLFDSPVCAELLLQFKADLGKFNSHGMTPLHLAVSQGSIRMVKVLCKDKEHINSRDYIGGQTPLSIAVQKKRSKDLLEILLSQGADVNILDKQGYGPLYYAIMADFDQGIQLLIKAGASMGTKDQSGKSIIQTVFDKEIS